MRQDRVEGDLAFELLVEKGVCRGDGEGAGREGREILE